MNTPASVCARALSRVCPLGWFALLLTAPSAGFAADLFVATNGVNNTNTNINGTGQNRGSLAFPFQTIDYAADQANPGDTVSIRGGTYREAVSPTVSGTTNAPIVFRPYNNEAVTLSGLQLIAPGVNSAGQWADEDGSGPGQVYRIQLNANYGSDSNFSKDRITGCQVFVDGEAMSEARWPNAPTPMGIRRSEAATAESGSRVLVEGTTRYDATYYVPSLNDFAADVWTNGIITYAAGSGWYRRVSTITGNTPAGALSEVRFNYDPYNDATNRENPNVGDPLFLMGRRVALDAEREFFFDTIQGASTTLGRDGPRHMLYLRLPGSVAPTGRVIEMRRRTYAIDLTAVSNLRFENLRVLAGRIRTRADTANCVFSGLELEYAAFTWQEELGEVTDASVYIQGSGHQFLDGSVRNTTGYGFVVNSANDIVIRNSVVSDCFITGVQLQTNSSNVRVENVTVYNIAGTGIAGGAKPHQVLYSHGYLNGLFATDCGTLNAGGVGDALGSEWAYNWMHSALGAVNSSRDWYGTPAIRLDAGFGGAGPTGPSNFLIHHNVVWNTTQPGSAISIWALRYNQTNFDDMKVKLYNNSVDQQIGFTETYGAATGITRVASLKGIELNNNVAGVGMGINSSSTDATGKLYITDMVVKNNLFPNRSIPENPVPPHSANRQGATDWINSALPPYGFELSPTSQAIDTGTVIPGVTDGFVGSAPDIGALESGLKPFVPGAKIRDSDLAGLTVTPITGGGTVRFLVAGLPTGRSLPGSFRLKVGAASASTDMIQNFDFVNHDVSIMVTAPSDPGADQPVQLSLDGTSFTTLPATVTVPEPGDDIVPAGVVRETFIDGAGSDFPQQYPGLAGAGWAGAWQTTSQSAGTLLSTTPVLTGDGNFLRVTRTAGTNSQDGVSRQWSSTTRPTDQFTRLTFSYRIDSDATDFNNASDIYSISLNSVPGASPGGNSTVYIRTFGAPPGGTTLQPREWAVFNGNPSVSTAYDVTRFRGTGLIAQPGVTYTFTVDVYSSAAAGSTNGKTHGTYDVSISDGTSTVSLPGSVFRSTALTAGGYLAFAAQQHLATDDLAFSVDSIELNALVAPSALELWRANHFTVEELSIPALEATLWGHLADPDSDGVANLLEYALGGIPTNAASAPFPTVSTTNDGKLQLTFTPLRGDVTYSVQSSSELGVWGTLVTNPGTLGEPVTVTDTPPPGATRRFLRLKVTAP